jgi:hypothetical protein
MFNGWFDPRVFIVFIDKFPDDFSYRDPKAFYMEASELAPKQVVYTRPVLEEVNRVFGEQKAFVFHHEYVHYIQALRSIANIWLLGSFVSTLQWAPEVRRVLAEAKGWPSVDTVFNLPDEQSRITMNTLFWFAASGDRLSTADIQESEAELLSE